MGSGASSGLAVALAATSEDGLASVFAEVPAEQRLRLQSALGAVGGAEDTVVETLEVLVSTLSGDVVGELAMPCTATVAQLKRWLSEQDGARTPVSRLCLLSGHQIVSDVDVLKDLVQAGSSGKLALQLIRKHRKVVQVVDPALLEGNGLIFKMFKMLLIGDGAVGKSSIVGRFTGKFSPSARATIGVDFRITHVLVDDLTHIKLQVWDTAGSERFRGNTSVCFRGASGIFIVFDVTARDTFEHLPRYLDDAEKHGSPDALILIIGNKADLVDKREVSEEEAVAFAAKLGLTYYGVSAMTGAKIEAPFHDLCTVLVDRTESAHNCSSQHGFVYVDAKPLDSEKGNPLRYVNGATAGSPQANVESFFADDRVFYYTVRPVPAGEELLVDYGPRYWGDHDDSAELAAADWADFTHDG